MSLKGARIGILLLALACQNGNDPQIRRTHPAGTIVAATVLTGRPYAAAVTPSGGALVGLLDNATLASTVLPDTSFGGTIPVGSVPTDIALDRNGTVAYVANQFDNDVQAVTAKTGAPIRVYPVSGNPLSVAAAGDGGSIFVTTNVDSIYRIATSSGAVLARRATDGSAAQSLVVDDASGRVYVSTRAAGTILELNASDLSLSRRFSPGGLTQEAGLVKGELWVANENGFVTIISLASGDTTHVNVAGQAWGLAVTPDEQQVWVGLLDVGVVKVIDVSSRQVVSTIRTSGRPRRIRFTATGDEAVIANEAGWVNVVK
jgi:YVTN family beta-propeller protein